MSLRLAGLHGCLQGCQFSSKAPARAHAHQGGLTSPTVSPKCCPFGHLLSHEPGGLCSPSGRLVCMAASRRLLLSSHAWPVGFVLDQACSHAWDDFAVAERRVKCSRHCCTQVLTFQLILCRKPSRRTSSSTGTQEAPRPAAAQGWLLLQWQLGQCCAHVVPSAAMHCCS